MEQTTSTVDEPMTASPHGETARLASPASSTDRRWQERLLPLMVRMVVGLTLFFFIASFAQLAYLHVQIQQAPEVDLSGLLGVPPNVSSVEEARQFNVLAELEAGNLRHRYHQANVFLMSRVWARYLGFVTGMILALVGAAFILGKLREETTELRAKGAAGSFSLQSTSPGLVLAVLGVALMITTIVTHHTITTADSPVYLRLAYEKPALASTPDSIAAADEPAADPNFP